MITPDRYRDLFSTVAAPVAVVTSMRGSRPHGTTVSAFTALSLDPPLVLVSLDRGSTLLHAIRRSRRFGLNVLGVGHEELALRFARKGDDKFDGVAWHPSAQLPRLDGAPGWLAADVHRIVGGGDHALVLGLIHEVDVAEGEPLLYHGRAFHSLRPLAA